MKSRLTIILVVVVALAIAIMVIENIYQSIEMKDNLQVNGKQQYNVDSSLLIGTWIETLPESQNKIQGFTLHHDGTAKSINMPSVKYKRWTLSNGLLTLTSISFDNECSIIEDKVYTIHAMGSKSIRLKTSSTSQSFKKWQPTQETNS